MKSAQQKQAEHDLIIRIYKEQLSRMTKTQAKMFVANTLGIPKTKVDIALREADLVRKYVKRSKGELAPNERLIDVPSKLTEGLTLLLTAREPASLLLDIHTGQITKVVPKRLGLAKYPEAKVEQVAFSIGDALNNLDAAVKSAPRNQRNIGNLLAGLTDDQKQMLKYRAHKHWEEAYYKGLAYKAIVRELESEGLR